MAPISFEKKIAPLLQRYCTNCHGEEKKKGDLALHVFKTEADVLKDRKTWAKVLDNLKAEEMPPEGIFGKGS